MGLFDPLRHEPLTQTRWDEDRARTAIDRIVADTNRAFSEPGLWPIHPLDLSPERPPDSLKLLYFGAAGIIWALHFLHETGAAPLTRDYVSTAQTLVQRHRDDLRKHPEVNRYMGRESAAYLTGEAGMLLLEWKLAPSEQGAGRLYAHCAATVGDPRGLVWGGAGSMLVLLLMYERTRDTRWNDLFLRHFEALWEQWKYIDQAGCYLWIHDLYGSVEPRLGALHGFPANAVAMMRGQHLVSTARRDEMTKRFADTLVATAMHEGSYANWANNAQPTNRATPAPIIVQHCNGAPGIVDSFADFTTAARPDVDELLRDAAELAWMAGPPVKLPSLCHGAPGTGYAFLKYHARTRDQLWLDRARSFAMHSIEQADRALQKYGQRKFSLWTGDLGLAVYLWDCIRVEAKFPTIDVF